MAQVPWSLAVAVGVQAGQGIANINTTIRDATGSLDAATHGLVLGDPESGIGESGIEVEFARELVEKAKLANFTLQASNLVRVALESLSIGWQLKGNGNVLSGTPADAEFALDPGIDALHRGLSLSGGAWGSGVGRIFVPAALTYLTVKVWLGGAVAGQPCLSWVMYDCVAQGALSWKPKAVGQGVAELVGIPTPSYIGLITTWPTFDYQEQASQSAPVVQNVAHAWGATRGFRSFEIKVANEVEEIDDSNAATGSTPRIVDRTITASAELYADGVDLNYEHDRLSDASAPTDAMSFTVGTAGVAAGRALAYRPRLVTPELRSMKPSRIGDVLGWEVELSAVSGVANGEFELIYL